MKRDTLITDLTESFTNLAKSEKKRKEVILYCVNQYGFRLGRISDLINGRFGLEEESDESLFFIASSVATQDTKFQLENYFTQAEIKEYKKSRYSETKAEFPFSFDCIEVEKGKQWIGIISAQRLISLDRAGLIKYNPNKQRVSKKVYKGGGYVDFQISVIEKSVNQIAKLMEKGDYIPDDITLDIPDDTEEAPVWEYDEEAKELIFRKLDHFDITDGYHRFLAMQKCIERNPSFDYPMELRITSFTEQITRQFIYQKDQKNKMTVSNSKSMNTERPSNDVVDRVNSRGYGSNLAGLISRGEGRVDYAALSDIIEYYYFKGKKETSNKDIAETTQEVVNILNEFTNEYVSYYDKDYLDFKRLVVLFYCIKNKGKTVKQAGKILEKAVQNDTIKEIRLRNMRKNLMDLLDRLNLC